MPVDVRMNYDTMEQMAKAFRQAQEQIGTTKDQMDKVVKMIDDGALVGQAGDALKSAIQDKLKKSLKVLEDKMKELDGDIMGAVAATRDGVSSAQSRFK